MAPVPTSTRAKKQSKKPTAKKSAAKKAPAKETVAQKPATKKPITKETAAKKPTTKKPTTKKPTTKKTAAKKPTTKKPTTKKPTTKKPTTKKPTTKKPTTKKPTAKKTAAKKPVAKKPSVKKIAEKSTLKKPVARKPASIKKIAELEHDDPTRDDILAPMSVESLLARGRALEAERDARAASERTRQQDVRPPVPVRPSSPIHWGYTFSIDEAVPEPQRGRLTRFFEQFTSLTNDRSGFLFVGPDTAPETRRAAWDRSGNVLECEQILAQLPSDDLDERTRRLTRALAEPTSEGWCEAAMLLTTWDRETLPAALTLAEQLLTRWPDVMRTTLDVWKHRPELQALVRVHAGSLDTSELSPSVTVLHTQDIDALRRHQGRLAHIQVLDVSGKPGLPAAVTRLTALVGLEKLFLMQPTYSEGTAKIDLHKLMRAPHLQRLRGLSLYGYRLDWRDVMAIADGPQPLEHLLLQYAKMQPSAAEALAMVVARKRLRTLDLKYNDLGPEGAQTLFGDPNAWASLRVLDFSANEIGDEGVAAITDAGLHDLRWLSLSSNDSKNQLTAASGHALANAGALANLHTLHVFGHPIGADGVAAIFNSPRLRSLRALNASFAGASLAELAERSGPDPIPVEQLGLGHLNRSGEKLDMTGATFLRSVRVLNLDSLAGNEYAPVFACPHLGDLEVLRLGGCYSEPGRALDALVTCTPPPNLHYLDLTGWKFTPQQAARLANSRLGRQLWGLGLMTSYTTPEAWRAFYDAGLPLVGSPLYDVNVPNEHATYTNFREEI